MTIEILQYSPFAPFMENGLRDRFQVHRWFEVQNRDEWLKEHGPAVRGIVTGGNLGVPNPMIERLPALGIIAISGVGFDKVDLELAKRRGIRVTNTPDVLTDDVADLTLGLIVGQFRSLAACDRYVREGRWAASPFPLGRKLTGRRFGILGFGRIGSAIAARLAPIGPVSYHATSDKNNQHRYFADPVQLAAASDVLIVATSANPSTLNFVGREVLDALGPQGVLVNIARGSVVDERELISALQDKRIAGAALDVFADEPHVPEALLALPNVALTPHIGSATHETRENMARLVMASLDAYFAGKPVPNAVA
jgi:lactate dehydrogenase-like 2-hydroxyacid dehydrogenase